MCVPKTPGRKRSQTSYGSIKRGLAKICRSHGQKIQHLFKQVGGLYDDGEILSDQFADILSHADKASKRFLKNVADMRRRFESKVESGGLGRADT